jgi:hypothetical protein
MRIVVEQVVISTKPRSHEIKWVLDPIFGFFSLELLPDLCIGSIFNPRNSMIIPAVKICTSLDRGQTKMLQERILIEPVESLVDTIEKYRTGREKTHSTHVFS